MSVALATGGPVVTLRSAPMTPFDGAIAAALVRKDPSVARAAHDAARVLLAAAGLTQI